MIGLNCWTEDCSRYEIKDRYSCLLDGYPPSQDRLTMRIDGCSDSQSNKDGNQSGKIEGHGFEGETRIN
jgi:hypothetical protein